ncbi:LLM class flavin-dependent oxidoreductase [Bacillaceae bacterium SIJ1]|uniref:LLM class flavin-dependent oxidoreductase n=1 Tax=Litoribacterium kuwaitense TaxID=1398745 RepID=UPI0013EDD707|nr:LLM class flavin-dependent oxidoreductase [Litoribacterium kuwaitense]NGP44788.1 LLM class flavin-dependent oxidoreductase [Litoribacterium kuwaitense]
MSGEDLRLKNTPISLLDLVPIVEGGTVAQAFEEAQRLAEHAEEWGYHRYWVAEHHNMPGIASAATSLMIQHVAQATRTMRVGSGGIMLPNHSSLVIAEQFGTLATLFPGRIDLGLGRAPGTDRLTAHALRRNLGQTGQEFPQQLEELRQYFDPAHGDGIPKVRAIPGEGLSIPIWLLGSSGFSAKLAGELGLPFAFASHFSPENTLPALRLYRDHFQPSAQLAEPYAMVAVNVIAAETNDKARFLATSMEQQFLNLMRDVRKPLPAPVENMNVRWTDTERALVEQRLDSSIVGDRKTVSSEIEAFLLETEADELMIHTQIYNAADRLASYRIVADIKNE